MTRTEHNSHARTRLLQMILKSSLSLSLLTLVIQALRFHKLSDPRLLFIAAFAATTTLSYLLLRRGWFVLSSSLFLAAFWAIFSGMLIMHGGSIRGPMMACSLIVTLLAGLLMGLRGGIVFTSLNLLTGAFLVYAELNGILQFRPAVYPQLILLLYVFLMGLTLTFLHVYTTQLKDLLQQSLTNAAALQNANDSLSQEIEKRKEVEATLRRYTTQLEAKNNELEQFSYVASHDLQEPLRTLISFTALLEGEYKEQLDDKAQHSLRFINEASQRMSALVKAMLEHSRLGKNRCIEEVDTQTLLDDIQSDLQLIIQEHQAQLTIHPLPTIQGYAVELRQLFQNLLGNAIKFQRPEIPPHIEITAVEEDMHWRFAIQDNGIGIATKHQDKIFAMFQRLHAREDYPGTGIGLANCKKIVELHQGQIWVDSNPGTGSTFHFTIAK